MVTILSFVPFITDNAHPEKRAAYFGIQRHYPVCFGQTTDRLVLPAPTWRANLSVWN